MKKILTGLSALGLFTAFGAGCGDDTGSGGSGGGDGGGSTTAATTSGATVTSTTSTGMMGDGNDTIDTASPMDENMGASFVQDAELNPPGTDVDFYSFNGVAGPVLIFGDAKPDADPFAEGYLDLVISVYDSNKVLIARNDDPFPRNSQDSSVYTILPSNGTYYLKVEEFCAFDGNCPDAEAYFASLDPLYSAFVLPLDPSDNSIMDEAVEPNETLGSATVMEYEAVDPVGDPGRYFLSIGYGDFTSAADVDGLNFTVPADLAFDAGSRASATFVLPPPGTQEGNGSAQNPGLIQVIDASTLTVVSRFDMSGEKADPDRAELTLPVMPGGNYLFTVQGGPAAIGTLAPFYFVVHGLGGGNPLEAEVGAGQNDSIVNAEVLTAAAMTDSYFIEGDLAAADATDWFSIASVPGTTLSVVCGAERGGSGIQGLTATVRNALNGNMITSGSETSTTQLLIQDINFQGATNVAIELTKTGQAAGVSGAYYRCGFHFSAP